MENPFSLKVGQIFTGVGVGCGVGVGIGQPIPFASIPVLHQVMSATRGATDIFSGATRHVNVFLKTTGVKNIEAGIGCGVGVGHGFGVGLALKPAVVHRIQSTLEQAVAKIMTKLGVSPDISSIESANPGHTPRSIGMLNGSSGRDVQASIGSVLDLASNKKPMQNYELTDTPEEKPPRTRTEKVLNTFLQNPLFKPEVEKDLKELAGDLRSENNLLHVLLKHEQVIEELKEENQKLRRVLLEDLKVSPSKLQAGIGNDSSTKFENPCSDCFECRRRKRKSLR